MKGAKAIIKQSTHSVMALDQAITMDPRAVKSLSSNHIRMPLTHELPHMGASPNGTNYNAPPSSSEKVDPGHPLRGHSRRACPT